ncbi:fluoride efflux transporter FluC [Acidipropionibacterium jensenii]|uniref:Fluoride-specific ion channel FluC n=2 Tax=Acidipropionibacterium jensenii TaxID=1749 RepID=A0A3S4UQM8_9ACTN|nr:CrcB family protein [Acidipropionibacterium jensenii]MDN5977180.1 CrcB family protein [Acidipropionibacterium jensenii]MDN5996707.1 CrcB family protein [Acidipropionibacterium jensenii]MDN6427076.1 CrcB family protein [Acidipropionibacterium jensenii]MDN6441051.1 CrcB family protein [Acidipropionibacterium jensenii]MDN6513791.1 CrcB family protein [Acidipropionibacterium jensenii]
MTSGAPDTPDDGDDRPDRREETTAGIRHRPPTGAGGAGQLQRRVTPTWALAVLVGAGGCLGTLLRAVLESAAAAPHGDLPVTTLAINLVGSVVLGALLEGLARTGDDVGARKAVRLGVGTGVIGGFTTYSTFAVEADRLIGGGSPLLGLGYAVGSVVAGVLCAIGGIVLARWFVSRSAGRRDRARTGESR